MKRHPIAFAATLAGAATAGAQDMNADHVIDQLDLNIVNSHWQQAGVGFSNGDANFDGIVDQLDLNDVTQHWQQTTLGRTGVAIVPEPSTFAILATGAIAIVARRKRFQ